MKANKGKTLLVLALVAVVAMAFRVSWNALRDVARAIGADNAAATLYPFVVDGLMALALVATLVLTDRADRKFALRVLAAYTVASLVLNYVHGLVPALHNAGGDRSRLADWGPANWTLVLLATSLPVGSIYFGSDLVAKVLHHRPAPQPTTPDRKAERLGAEQEKPAPAGASGEPSPSADQSARPVPVEPAEAPSAVAPTDRPPVRSAPRRATGRLPKSARSPRPTRTYEELLDEARTATVDWPDEKVTAEAIRKALRTGLPKARLLRDALLAERATPSTSAMVADVEQSAPTTAVAA